MKKYIIISFILMSYLSNAQESFEIGKKYRLYSDILKEERSFWVHLPKDYNQFEQEKYPVAYVLDGETQFQQVVSTEAFLSKGMYASIPQMIVVGIINTDRTRDLTPSHAPIQRIERKGASFETSGGADKFHRFLEHELQPFINKAFRTSNYNLLIGHSFGGLFSIYSLIHHPNTFQAYFAIDPSLWWNNNEMLKEAETNLHTGYFKGKSLYVAMAHNPPTARDTSTNHPRAIERFTKHILTQKSSNQLRWNWKFYERYDHGTVVLPSVFDAFKYLFEGLQLEVKDIPTNPTLVKNQYEDVSQKIGFPLHINLGLLKQLQEYAKSQGYLESVQELEKLKIR